MPYRQTEYRRPWPSETLSAGLPPRRLPRALVVVIVGGGGWLWTTACLSIVVLVAVLVIRAEPRLVAIVGASTLFAVLGVSAMRWRVARLLRLGAFMPAELLEQEQARFSGTEQTVLRVLADWRTEIASYEGPVLKSRLRVGMADGPKAVVTRSGGPAAGDLCVFIPERPSRHMFVDELPAGLTAKGGALQYSPQPVTTLMALSTLVCAGGSAVLGLVSIVWAIAAYAG